MDIKELKIEVYKNGLNIYALLNRVQKETSYELPEELIRMVCEDYLKHRPNIKNQWAYMNKVLKLKRDELHVQLQQKRETKNKDTNSMLLKNLFGGG